MTAVLDNRSLRIAVVFAMVASAGVDVRFIPSLVLRCFARRRLAISVGDRLVQKIQDEMRANVRNDPGKDQLSSPSRGENTGTAQKPPRNPGRQDEMPKDNNAKQRGQQFRLYGARLSSGSVPELYS